MAYTKQTWVTGETITADKLNHMEDGIAAGGDLPFYMVSFSEANDVIVCDTEPSDIIAMAQQKPVCGKYSDGVTGYQLLGCFSASSEGIVFLGFGNSDDGQVKIHWNSEDGWTLIG